MPRPDAARRHAAQQRLSHQTGGFDAGLTRFRQKLLGLEAHLVPEVAALTYESIVHGSTLTGAPGQPEASGDLKGSWRTEFPTPGSFAVTTASPYARANEEGRREGGKPYVQRSAVGGRHSVKLTRQGLQRIVNYVVRSIMREAA